MTNQQQQQAASDLQVARNLIVQAFSLLAEAVRRLGEVEKQIPMETQNAVRNAAWEEYRREAAK